MAGIFGALFGRKKAQPNLKEEIKIALPAQEEGPCTCEKCACDKPLVNEADAEALHEMDAVQVEEMPQEEMIEIPVPEVACAPDEKETEEKMEQAQQGEHDETIEELEEEPVEEP
ncbi:hypothetical protein LJB77_01990 [Ruminococcaceae bacterium OttesenSCG-928-N02]|nr:hypothetical protein [Ruminococcaceae bacterium OttesenSCG-928-N02]